MTKVAEYIAQQLRASVSIANTATRAAITPVFNVKGYGAVGDGTTNDYNSINNALTALNNAGGGTLYFPKATSYKISSNMTFPSTCTLMFDNGAMLSPNSGVTITINGPIIAGLTQIFTGADTIVGVPKIEKFYPQWFGAKGDGVTNDTNAIQSCINLAAIGGGIIYFAPSTYIATGLSIPNTAKPLRFLGNGWNNSGTSTSIIKGSSATSIFSFVANSHGHSFVDLELDGNNIATYGIDATNSGFLYVYHCRIKNINGTGVYNNQGIPNIQGCYVTNCTGDGFNLRNDGFFYNNEVASCTGAGLRLRSGGMRVYGNDIYNCGYGIYLDGPNATSPDQIAHNDISHNYIDNNGICIYGLPTTGGNISFMTICDNYLDVGPGNMSNTDIINITALIDSTICNNNIYGGLLVGSGVGNNGIVLTSAQRVLISGGAIRNVVNNPVKLIDSTDCKVSNMVINACCVLTTTYPYGVYMTNNTGACTRNTVDNIEFVDGRSPGYLGGVYDVGSSGGNIITNCYLYTPVALSYYFNLHSASYLASRKNNEYRFIIPGTGGVVLDGNAWNNNPLVLGGYYIWMDGSGRLRIKSGIPASDTDGVPSGTLVSAPATATSTGVPGQFATDGSYFYICTATNTWRRVAIAAW